MTPAEPGDIQRDIRALADPRDAEFLQRFFRTAPGEYGEGDRFLGIRVPQLRRLARAHRGLSLDATLELLRSPWHEERLVALLLLVDGHRRGDDVARRAIHDAYLAHTRFINSWDLVDVSAEHIVGPHTDPDDVGVLVHLARSDSLWERRIAIMATFHWTRQRRFQPTLHIADVLLQDPHDLIRKAVGWMLREVGNRDRAAEEAFLASRYRRMPRVMLRYAIERFPEDRRQQYLRGEV